MSVITDEVLAAMAAARIKSRKAYMVNLATFTVNGLRNEADDLGIPFDDYSGDHLALIEVLAAERFPQLISEPATRDAYEADQPVVDEVSEWFATGQANAQASAYMTPDVIKLDAQAMTPEYADMSGRPDTVTLDRHAYEELSRSEADKYAREKINKRIAEIYYYLSIGQVPEALNLIQEFTAKNEVNLADYISGWQATEPVKLIPMFALHDRVGRLFDGLLDQYTVGVLVEHLTRPYQADNNHEGSIGVPETRSHLTNVLCGPWVKEAIRAYMTGHWSTASIEAIIQAALATAGNGRVAQPEPVSSWPQAGPVEEPTMLTPIIEPNEVDPGTQQPSFYSGWDHPAPKPQD